MSNENNDLPPNSNNYTAPAITPLSPEDRARMERPHGEGGVGQAVAVPDDVPVLVAGW